MLARLSPDRRRLATVRTDPVDFGRSVWVLDLEHSVETPISIDGDMDDPVWSPDGQRVAFAWHRPGQEPSNVHELRPDQPVDPRPMVTPGAIRWPVDWSADGRLVLYARPSARPRRCGC